MEYLSLRQIQLEELKIAKEVDKFCNQNNINYYLSSGSLLGAIRHGGFIPWDDDIDMWMLRPDYDRFCENFHHEEFVIKYCENGSLHAPFAKVCNPNIKVECENLGDTDNSLLWLDIFPVDGISSNILVRKLRYLHLGILIKEINLQRNKLTDESNSIFFTVKRLFYKDFQMKSPDYAIKKAVEISNISRQYEVFTTGLSGVAFSRLFFDDSIFTERSKYKFEDTKFFSFSNYDIVLKKNFGNYLELPPIDKRGGHYIKAHYQQ